VAISRGSGSRPAAAWSSLLSRSLAAWSTSAPGGSAVRGGAGSFLSWLTITTAYRDVDYAAEVANDDLGTMRLRPTIPLA
jgi:hypothetical protein